MTDKPESLGEIVRRAFDEARREVAERALREGLSVVGTIDGKMVQVHPDGTIEELKGKDMPPR